MSRRYAYDANQHEYLDVTRGEVLPHITGLLKRGGWVDDEWYTDECKVRGSAVHQLTADFDLASFTRADLPALTSPYKSYLEAHVSLCDLLSPKWEMVEEALIHEYWRFGGRPDRLAKIGGVLTLCEIKSGGKESWHGIQLALQAILVEPEIKVPATQIQRWGWYLQRNGKGKIEKYTDPADFDKAYRILTDVCEVAA
ncbi:MAG TPA: hypothetical protein PKZ07_16140 [Sedimentisphaerales bacterium]|nr:hypothetical protein [Sedimentisphaerales bacterium]